MLKRKIIFIFLFISSGIIVNGQPKQISFEQGLVSYKVDTISRLITQPSPFPLSQFDVYIKGELVRFDVVKRDLRNKNNIIKFTEIRNLQGIYSILEMSDTASAITLFRSYEEDKDEDKTWLMENHNELAKVDKNIKDTTWLKIPAQCVSFSNNKSNTEAAIVTSAIQIPIKYFFKKFSRLQLTPLQFSEADESWNYKLTAIKISAQPVQDSLFEVNKNNKLISPKELIQEIKKN